jgi:hypothetical protein
VKPTYVIVGTRSEQHEEERGQQQRKQTRREEGGHGAENRTRLQQRMGDSAPGNPAVGSVCVTDGASVGVKCGGSAAKRSASDPQVLEVVPQLCSRTLQCLVRVDAVTSVALCVFGDLEAGG